MVKRIVAVAVALSIALLTLTGCENKASRAAAVGNHTISESTLNQYVVKGAPKYTQSDSQSGQSISIVPRHQALQVLILVQLFDDVFATKGGRPSDASITAVTNQLITGEQRTQIAQSFASHGYTTKYTALYLRFQGELKLLEQALNDDGSDSAVVSALRGLKTKVDVNPRYGTWNTQQVALDESGAVPSFITLSGAAPTAAPAA